MSFGSEGTLKLLTEAMCADKVVRFIKKCLRGEESTAKSIVFESSSTSENARQINQYQQSTGSAPTDHNGRLRRTPGKTERRKRRALPDVLQSQNICSITSSKFVKRNLLLFIAALSAHCAYGFHFISVGDWGDAVPSGIQNQALVAQAMSDWCGTHVCDFILSTGDNFYEDGVTSATDVRFDTSWRSVYNLPNIADSLWYISIGNRDHGSNDGREQFQVDFGLTESMWHCPSLWYDAHYTDGTTTLHLIVLESESLKQNKNDPAAQLAWLETTLAASTDYWKVIVVHHPPYSAANYGPADTTIVNDVVPIALHYGADMFLSGHDHNMQHITYSDDSSPVDFIVTGAGGRSLYAIVPENERALNDLGMTINYFGYYYGFVAFDFTATSYTAQFVDLNGNVGHTFTKNKN